MREKKVSIGALNITAHPHKPSRYVGLLRDARHLVAQLSSDRAGMLASATERTLSKNSETKVVTGDIYRFNNIDPDGEWFNTLTNETADEQARSELKIPEHLKPNSARFSYIFFPESHILFYESYYDGKSLGSSTAKKLIERALNHRRLGDKYGVVDITVVPEKDAIEKALSMPVIEHLDIVVSRPNPDDNPDAEKEVLKRMTNQNASKFEQRLSSIPGTSVEPDSETKQLAYVAAKNGYVEARGKDAQGKPDSVKTTNHPWSERTYYNPDLETSYDAFEGLVLKEKDHVEHWIDNLE